jgi:hypothetical protein
VNSLKRSVHKLSRRLIVIARLNLLPAISVFYLLIIA